MISQLIEKIKKTNAPICIGLDPMLSYVPRRVVKKPSDAYEEALERTADAIWQFNKEIIDHIYDLILTVKLQIAIHEQFGIKGLIAYEKTMEYYHEKGLTVIGDTRRGDVGSTSAAYATGHLGVVQVGSNAYRGFNVDMFTVNPYLRTDGAKPFMDVCNTDDKGLFVLVETSNPSSGEFRDHLIDGRPLYEWVAQKTMEWGAVSVDGVYSNVGAVVGATYPEVGRTLRKLMPATYFLVPGYGAQGGTADDLKHCFSEDGLRATMNSSRGIITVYKQGKYKQFGPEHFDKAFRRAVLDMVADTNNVL